MIEANPLLKRKREREQKKEKQTRGFAYREDYYYTPNHFWLKIEGDMVKVGVDDFAVKLIGKIDTLKILVDKFFEKNQECLELGSKNRMARMKLPLSVALIEINEIVKSQPSLITKDPYNLGWLFKIKQPQEIGEFNKGENVRVWLEKEFDRLHQEFEENVGMTIADGGEIAKDLHERVTDEQWSILVKKFLS
jgi:glycine cleavage system H protein